MDRDELQSFITSAEKDLAMVRRSLLVSAQAGGSDLAWASRSLARIREDASANGMAAIAGLAQKCETSIALVSASDAGPSHAYEILDDLARIEAALWSDLFWSDELGFDIEQFVDSSFDALFPTADNAPPAAVPDGFFADEETLEIFRGEADELLRGIRDDLAALSQAPRDLDRLWSIRRNLHTFKGSAGIIGLQNASEAAHRMEDVVIQMADGGGGASSAAVDSLTIPFKYLESTVFPSQGAEINNARPRPGTPRPDASVPDVQTEESVKRAATAVVRVSLARLDAIVAVTRELLTNRAELAVNFPANNGVTDLIESQKSLIDELHAKLIGLRMVRFGTLQTRLTRAVQSTCDDEGKNASLRVENGDIEVDTQLIDTLIEPLLHLLKNAVVHGLEAPDTRRLLGKDESGLIRVRLETEPRVLRLSVTDDGSGIPVQTLKEKAVLKGLIKHEELDSITDDSVLQLIFEPGLTTAEKVDLNAGRGVGMSIVQER
ncbi:MAG: chemotaxis protein CheA, partial [Pyrinomonadaceae bacterium]